MPSCNFSLFVDKPKTYTKHPKTIGEHILKRRIELELRQKDVGKLIGVGNFTIMNWEKGDAQPSIKHYPAIISFLGYEPFPEPRTLGERIIAWRHRNGFSRKALARQLGVDEAALARREMDIASTTGTAAVMLNNFLHKWLEDDLSMNLFIR